MRFPIARVPADLPDGTQAVKHSDQGEREDSPWSLCRASYWPKELYGRWRFVCR